jgi:2,3-bisphosphoglycerate-independent phosphoglycerate mutase
MANFDVMRELAQENGNKIVLLVMDGLGGLPLKPGGPTELEAANTPVMDQLAREGVTGQSVPVGAGIAPGSGPAHLALFGYDPIVYKIGRGVLEAFGIGFDLHAEDVAGRGNFCTVDANGMIVDRRAGRISTELCAQLVDRLRVIKLPDVELFVEPVRDYRFIVVLRGDGLSAQISETDPLVIGKPPLRCTPEATDAVKTADLVNLFVEAAAPLLADQPAANMLTIRGWSKDPNLPKYKDVYKLKGAAVAVYPMYKGVSKLVGMDVLPVSGESPTDEFNVVREHWTEYDFFFVHIKPTDSRGEDGDFEAKARVIEGVDQALPLLLDMKPDVLVITGDHSTPALLRTHSWHPVPTLLWAPGQTRTDASQAFGETECSRGNLGTFPATDIMPLALGHAMRLTRYGA